MPGELIWPSASGRNRREIQRAAGDYKLGELQALLDKQSTVRFMTDVVDVVGMARRMAGNDPALLAMLAPILENWMNREGTTLQFRNINRMMGGR